MELVDSRTIAEIGAGLLVGWGFKGARGAAGGILICWNSTLWRAVEQSVGTFSFSVLLEDLQSGGRWCCSSVYGPNDDADRAILWDELSAIRARCSVTSDIERSRSSVLTSSNSNNNGSLPPRHPLCSVTPKERIRPTTLNRKNYSNDMTLSSRDNEVQAYP
ncbi:hypothetical protein QJS10_CPA06g00213 [Acorus calamus]|uniref:Uncharacterized protein n=1 Tax=Acorus calamus TaxID=4465 RepID=A0AAV9ELI7_ACOCL|nr:hypothetical protein QJS10_CPA06g00213 [Acorus calamus]